MQTKNDYDKEGYNGDVGYVKDVDLEAGELSASFDGRTVVYGFGELDALVPAYATTVHKSQGSEYPAVVLPVLTQHYAMLQRNLLYTGVTRGNGCRCRNRLFPDFTPTLSIQQEHPRVKKADLASRIADEIGLTKARTEDAVNAILDGVKQALSEGEPVILRRLPGARQAPAAGAQSQDGRRNRHPGQAGGTVQGREVFQGCGQRRWLV